MIAGLTIVFICLFMFFIASFVLCFVVVYRLLVFKTNAATRSNPLANALVMIKY